MRTRFAVLLAVTAFVLLLLPTACLALVNWNGSKVTIQTATGWTNKGSIHLDFYGSAAWVPEQPGDAGVLAVFLRGDGVLDSASKQVGYDSGGMTPGVLNGVSVFIAWCSGDVDAPVTSGDGEKQLELQYRLDKPTGSVWSPTFKGTVTVDTHGPKTIAPYPLSCKRGGYATVSYQVDDTASPKADVSLRVTNSKGKTVSSASIGEQETGKLLTYLWKCNLGAGKYKYSILATDLAGNKASKAGKNALTVK